MKVASECALITVGQPIYHLSYQSPKLLSMLRQVEAKQKSLIIHDHTACRPCAIQMHDIDYMLAPCVHAAETVRSMARRSVSSCTDKDLVLRQVTLGLHLPQFPQDA